jgi:hypothetical protein
MTTETLLLPAASALPAGVWPGAWPRRRRLRPLLAACNLATLLLAAWSVARPPSPPPPPVTLPIPAPLPAAPPPSTALPEPLVAPELPTTPAAPPLAPGAAWALDEALPQLEGRLDAAGLEIQDLVEAIMGLRQDSALLAEDGQLAHERLKALEQRLGQGRTRAKAAQPAPAPPPAPPATPPGAAAP